MEFIKKYGWRLLGYFILLNIIFSGQLETQRGKSFFGLVVALLIFGAYNRYQLKKLEDKEN